MKIPNEREEKSTKESLKLKLDKTCLYDDLLFYPRHAIHPCLEPDPIIS